MIVNHIHYNIPSVAATCQQLFFHTVLLAMPSFSFVPPFSAAVLLGAFLLALWRPFVSVELYIAEFVPSLSHGTVS